MSIIALVPARRNSKGIAGKNFRRLGGKTLIALAVEAARQANCDPIVITSDVVVTKQLEWGCGANRTRYLLRDEALAQDTTPMIDVVRDALARVPGEPDDILVLLQPTQPFRTTAYVQAAIALLQESGADSVVSVTPLPLTHCPEFACHVMGGQLYAIHHGEDGWSCYGVAYQPTRRQDVMPAYKRDGTVYCFWRRTVEQHGTIYGQIVKPLIILPEETCELDTEADWQAVEQRWKERHETTRR